MKLFYNPASPFAHKVRVVAIEAGLDDRLELDSALLTPVQPNDKVLAENPLGKIPCLVTPDLGPLYDSRVIAEYLAGLHAGLRLFPVAGEARWRALRQPALGDGIMDAGVLGRYETLVRPPERQWDVWLDHQMQKINRALDHLDRPAGRPGDGVDIGTITLACALGYLDYRFAEAGWRAGRPTLTSWFERFGERAAMVRTHPEAAA